MCLDDRSTLGGSPRGSHLAVSESCPHLVALGFALSRSQPGQDFEGDIHLALARGESDHVGPMGRRDAALPPAADRRVGLAKGFGKTAGAAKGVDDGVGAVHVADHSSHHAN